MYIWVKNDISCSAVIQRMGVICLSKKIPSSTFSMDIDDLITKDQTRDNIDYRLLLYRAIERCNQAISVPDTSIFEANVRALLANCPSSVRETVLDRARDFNTIEHKWVFRKFCGFELGTPENPITINDEPPKEDWSNVISPKPTRIEATDYERLLEVILTELENSGYSWKGVENISSLSEMPVEEPKPTPKFLDESTVELTPEALNLGMDTLFSTYNKAKASNPDMSFTKYLGALIDFAGDVE
jgi:hypothetical protein